MSYYIRMKAMNVLLILPLLFAIIIPFDKVLGTGIPIEEQLRMAREKNSTAQTDDPGIQSEDRFTIDSKEGPPPPPLKILSQNSGVSYDDFSRGLVLRITGEVMNPTGEICCAIGGDGSVLMVVTLYDANNQTLSNEKGPINYDLGDGMIPNQVYPYEVTTGEGALKLNGDPLDFDEIASYSLGVGWMPDY